MTTRLDVDLRCGPAACTGKTRVALGQYKWYDGTHRERLPPGALPADHVDLTVRAAADVQP